MSNKYFGILILLLILLLACVPQQPISKVSAPETDKKETNVKEFIVVSDDYGFYPNKIKANIDNKVVIHFKFRDDLIYYGGMDVKGPFPDLNYKLKGEQPITREFVMEEETRITSYWPATGIKKATLIVEVEK